MEGILDSSAQLMKVRTCANVRTSIEIRTSSEVRTSTQIRNSVAVAVKQGVRVWAEICTTRTASCLFCRGDSRLIKCLGETETRLW